MHGDKIRNLRYRNERLQQENERLKSQFKYANGGKGIAIPDFSGQEFDRTKLLERYKEHLRQYAQLRRDFREVKQKCWGMRSTLIQWKEIFNKHDMEFEDEHDIE
jgi:hypothetical protein